MLIVYRSLGPLLIFLWCFTPVHLHGQSVGEAWYKLTTEPMPTEMLDMWKSISKDSTKTDSVLNEMNNEGGELMFKVSFDHASSVSAYQDTHIEEHPMNLAQSLVIDSRPFCYDWEKGEIMTSKIFEDEHYTVISNVDSIKWVFTNEEKKIGEYHCKKAEQYFTRMDGPKEVKKASVEAWYTLDIPRPIGPSELVGLPGLVVEVRTGALRYRLQDFYYTPGSKESCPLEGPYLSEKEFYDTMLKSYKKDFEKWKGRKWSNGKN